ncbi:S-adenosylmethionine decarboxylase proenzyme [Calothrix sp. NIES-2100]|uniref:S-adenosylmethionine decarboxylase family protein n=1 Tax=Calothrix sp. NIES-2100 TaxID=1954172 RepID=UPI000B5E0E29|nr:S-adenosylmethionine decarboxylase proenzyme [Calothrix sp. NIES-2100]
MIRSHHFYAILPASETVFRWETADFIRVVKNAANQANLTVIGELAYAFQPQGVSAVILLAESHVALHFWPEEAKVTIDIHICNYQQDNQQKARLLAQLLTIQITESDSMCHWNYLYISG